MAECTQKDNEMIDLGEIATPKSKQRGSGSALMRLVRRETPTVTCEGCAFDDEDGPVCKRPATIDDCSGDNGEQYIYFEVTQ